MGNNIVFLCPYFGTIEKDQFKLWLKSCAKNDTIDFLLITNDEAALTFDLPNNVKPIKMTWDECVELLQKNYDFDLTVTYTYKLCDFRPAFGEIFADYIKDYDFWGHTDSGDTILGDLRAFLTDDILDNYDKVHIYGHLTLFRNAPENNARYRIPADSGLTIKEIFTAEENMCFDDMYQKASINRIYEENGFSLQKEVKDLVADILPYDWSFKLAQDNDKSIPRVFEWNDGKLYEHIVYDEEVKKREIGYVHFQKRKIRNSTKEGTNHFYFIPNEFVDAEHELTADEIKEFSKDRLYLDPLKGRIKRVMWYAKHPKSFKRKLNEKLKG